MIYDIPVPAIDGTTRTMDTYRGKVRLVINVASDCGYPPQYAELEALYRKYQDREFVVLGFPCTQFGGQEPGTEATKWHFTKFLVGRSGDVVKRYGSSTTPRQIDADVVAQLG